MKTDSFRIKVAGKWIDDSGLTSLTIDDSYNEQEKKSITFCKAWLNGQQKFTFKTSGSTGTPKEITFDRDQLAASAAMTVKALNLKKGNNSAVCLNVDLIAGALMLVRGMIGGMNMIIEEPSSKPLIAIREHIHFTALVPYQIIGLLKESNFNFKAVDQIIIGGAPLDQTTIHQLQRIPTACYATYGMTETITHVALQRLNGKGKQDFFEFLPGISGNTDNRGCLVIHAPHLSEEIITNDIVSFIDQDKFKWLGRYDRVINSGGIKINPEKTEEVISVILSELNLTNRFFADGIVDEALGQKLVLVIEGNLKIEDELKIRERMTTKSNKYEVPKQIIVVRSFIETASQKIDRGSILRLIVNG